LVLGLSFALVFSIAVAEALAYLAIALWLCSSVATRRTGLWRSPFVVPVALFAVAALLSSAFGLRPAHSLLKCHRLVLVLLIFVVEDAFRPERGAGRPGVERMAGAFVLGASCLGAFDAVRVLVETRLGVALYDTGNMRDPQFYMVSLCFLSAGLAGLVAARRKLLGAGAIVLNAVGLVLHFKRGVWISFALVATGLAAALRKYRIVLALALSSLVLLAAPPVRHRMRQLGREWSEAQGGRYVLWTRVAPAVLKAHPMGVGVRALRHEDLLRRSPRVQAGLDHLHNNLLQVAVETGWLGLVAWLYWMGTVFWVYMRAGRGTGTPEWLRLGGLAGFSGLMLNGLVEYNFGDSEILILLCLLMGMGEVLRARGTTDRAAAS
jgi:O-antigen ligase